jgi:hypothetical protein
MKKLVLAICFTTTGCMLDYDKFRFREGEGGGGSSGSTTSGDCASHTTGTAESSASTASGNSSTGSSSSGDCTVSTGGQSGDGGMASTGGTGGNGGQGGSTSSSSGGEGGNTSSSGGGGSGGGTTSSTGGGGGSSPTGCEAGAEATPNDLEGWGNEESASLLVQQDGSMDFQYSANGGMANSLSYTLSNTDTFPGQLVLTGLNGIHSRLKEGSQDRPQATYLVQGSLIPYTECVADFYSEECLAIVAKDYRCQNGSGEPDCPVPELVYSSQGSIASYDLNIDGDWLVLVDIQCEP